MSAARTMTSTEYLAFERKEEWKHELRGGVVVAMPLPDLRHNLIVTNLIVGVGSRLKGSGCYTLSQRMRVKVPATGLYTYPDHIIMCDPPEVEDEHRDTLLNPRAIVEVLSDSTEQYDRGAKFRHYRQIESLREYVLVSHREPMAEHFTRQPNGQWALCSLAGLDAELVLETVPARVRLADVYAGVTFPEPTFPEPPPPRNGDPAAP